MRVNERDTETEREIKRQSEGGTRGREGKDTPSTNAPNTPPLCGALCGALVESMPFDRRVVGSNPAVAVT